MDETKLYNAWMRILAGGCRIFALVLFVLSLPGCSDASDRSASGIDASSRITYVIELEAGASARIAAGDGVELLERFTAAEKSYAVLRAESAAALAEHLERAGIAVQKVTEVRDVNSPTRGGGRAAAHRLRTGHTTFVIERRIPGVGTFPEERKQAIAKRSNAAVAELGDTIEWERSYLTDEGTYCIYRATDEATIRRHGAITGAPVNRVSEVRRQDPVLTPPN